MKKIPLALGAVCVGLAAPAAMAASIFLTPTSRSVDASAGSASFELMMDFSASEVTVGGGIDLDINGPATLSGFTPSSYFTGTADPAFSNFGTALADNDLEIHFGSFNGLSGANMLGTLTLNFSGPGTTTLALGVNSSFGAFQSLTATTIPVTFGGATLVVTTVTPPPPPPDGEVPAIPEPQTYALMLAGLVAVAWARRRRRVPV